MRKIAVGLLLLAMLAGCCDILTVETKNVFDKNAIYARHIANAGASGSLSPADQAYYAEVFARTFENLSNAGHWQPKTFSGPPTNRPTTLPWKPEGGLSAQ
jgi:hypothetical protein